MKKDRLQHARGGATEESNGIQLLIFFRIIFLSVEVAAPQNISSTPPLSSIFAGTAAPTFLHSAGDPFLRRAAAVGRFRFLLIKPLFDVFNCMIEQACRGAVTFSIFISFLGRTVDY